MRLHRIIFGVVYRVLGTLILLWLFCSDLQAQRANVDSLYAALDSLPEDTNKVNAYLTEFRPLMVSDGEAAMELTERAMALAIQLGYKNGEAEAIRMQGIYYMINGAHELALERYQKSYEIFVALGNQPFVMRCQNNFATVYLEMELYDTALNYLAGLDRLKLNNRTDSMLHATMKHNEAICLDMTGKHQQAFERFGLNLKTFEQCGAEYEQSFTLNSLGETATKLGKLDLAITYLRAGEALKRKLDDQRGVTRSLILLAGAYLKMGNRDSASTIGLRSLDVAKLTADAGLVGESQKVMAEIYAAGGQHDKAYTAMLQYVHLSDSLKTAGNLSKLMGLQTAYGLKNKNDEIKQLQQTNALDQANLGRQRLLIFSMAGGILLVLIVLLLIYRSSVARARLNEAISAKNQELSTANEALQHSLVEREALVHMIIHDLKSPLNHTEALIQAMRDVEGMPALSLKMMEKVEITNRRGIELISDLLALYQIDAQAKMPLGKTDCTALAAAVVSSMEAYATQKGIQLALSFPKEMPAAHTNASMVTRILENLVSNALKFSNRGTSVKVQVEIKEGEIIVSVSDQGPGISPADHARLFEKFSKLNARPTGGEHSNGLGLAIVKKLVEQLHGRVGVASELGHGATFWVAIPVN
jgi:signal transduction histidine kinase